MIRPLPQRSVAGVLVLVGLGVSVGCGKVERDEPAEATTEVAGPTDPSKSPPDDDEPPQDPPEDPPEDPPPGPPEDPPGDPPDEPPLGEDCPEAGTPVASPLELPASVRTDPIEHAGYPTGAVSGDSEPIEVAVPFDLGPEAPDTLSFKLGSVYDLECGQLEGPFTIDSIQVLEGSAQVTQSGEPDVFTLQADEAGNSVVEVRGVLQATSGGTCSDEPTEVPLVFSFAIQAEEFEWSVQPRSTCPLSIASGRPLPLDVVARDAAGEVRHPWNLLKPSLSLSTSEGLELQTFDSAEFYSGLGPSVTPVGSGTLTVAVADGSSSVDLRVFPPEELDDVYLEFTLSGIVARGDAELESGGSYRFVGEEPQVNVYARWAGVEGMWMCGAPDANDLSVTSLTPDVCRVEGRVCQPQEDSVLGNLLYESVPVVANGTCTLRIEAPTYAGGAGLSYEVTFEMEDRDLIAD